MIAEKWAVKYNDNAMDSEVQWAIIDEMTEASVVVEHFELNGYPVGIFKMGDGTLVVLGEESQAVALNLNT